MASAYGHQTPPQARRRAAIVLPAARGCPSARVAARSRMHVNTVRTWRGGFAAGGPPALSDRRRSGRPPCPTAGTRGDRPRSPRRRSPRSTRRPASHPTRPGPHCRPRRPTRSSVALAA
ncbi:helix-turn-helix domain-containing protein [Streptomyces sp. NPDC051452]|uniref:helix-turn-helix domain-containing protein n=1 Tax=Streptomyces sp. NPDC051452 TaxID=3365654 RepID=UPI0037979A25